MKLTFKEKAKLFWDRNKAEILGWLVTAGVVTAIGGIGVCITNKKNRKRRAGKRTYSERARTEAAGRNG